MTTRRANRWAKNVSRTTRIALRTLQINYGSNIAFASVQIRHDQVEIALFGGTITQEWAEEALDLLNRGKIHIFIPDQRVGQGPPTPVLTGND